LRILLSVSVVLLAGIAALLAVQTFNRPLGIWSYAVIAPKDEDLIKELNQAGSLGWEVVSARRATAGEDGLSGASYEMILKRRGAPELLARQTSSRKVAAELDLTKVGLQSKERVLEILGLPVRENDPKPGHDTYSWGLVNYKNGYLSDIDYKYQARPSTIREALERGGCPLVRRK